MYLHELYLWWRSSPPNDFRVRIRVRLSNLGGELLHQRPVSEVLHQFW